jgi:hypothetical protein
LMSHAGDVGNETQTLQEWSIVAAVTLDSIWKARNNMLFRRKTVYLGQVVEWMQNSVGRTSYLSKATPC